MSEQSVTEKLTEKITTTISETLNNIYKKSELSDKAENIKILLGISLLIPTTIAILGYIGYNNLRYENKGLQRDIQQTYNLNYEYSQKLNNCIDAFNLKISILETELKEKFEKQQALLIAISETPLLNIYKEKPISTCSSNISIFMEDSPGKPVIHIEEENKTTENTNEKDGIHNDDDNELLNECYDSIPLSNVKKVTGIKSFIWFGGN